MKGELKKKQTWCISTSAFLPLNSWQNSTNISFPAEVKLNIFIHMSIEHHPYRHVVSAGYSDFFNRRTVQPAAMMSYLEESAAGHCHSIGQDLFTLLEKGQGWVLTGGSMRIVRYPEYGETIVIETWISEWKGFTGIREYRISTLKGDVLGEAGGRWVYWDVNYRKPLPIPEIFKKSWFIDRDSPYRRMYPESTTPVFPTALPGVNDESRINLRVRRGDVDLYGHLHNTCYMDWLMESVPDSLYRDSEPREMGIRFLGEALLGDEVIFTTRNVLKGLIHEVKRLKDGKLLARGFSEWVDKKDKLTA